MDKVQKYNSFNKLKQLRITYFSRLSPHFTNISTNGPQVSDSIRTKCYLLGLKPFLRLIFPQLIHISDAVSSEPNLRLSQIR